MKEYCACFGGEPLEESERKEEHVNQACRRMRITNFAGYHRQSRPFAELLRRGSAILSSFRLAGMDVTLFIRGYNFSIDIFMQVDGGGCSWMGQTAMFISPRYSTCRQLNPMVR